MSRFNEYSTIAQVAIRTAANAFVSTAQLEEQWQPLRFHEQPDLDEANIEYRQFKQLLAAKGAEIIELSAADNLTIDSIYTRDSILVSPNGLILCNMGRASRTPEANINAAPIRLWATRWPVKSLHQAHWKEAILSGSTTSMPP